MKKEKSGYISPYFEICKFFEREKKPNHNTSSVNSADSHFASLVTFN